MRFGKIENNYLAKGCQYILALFIFCSCACSVACQTKEQKIDAALKSCQEILDKDDVEAAYKCFLKVGKTYPEDDPHIVDVGDKAIFRKCVEFKERKNFQQAAFCFEGLTKLRLNSATIYFQIADSYYEIFKMQSEEDDYQDTEILDKAGNAVKKGLEISPEDAAAHALYGDILGKKNDWQGAVKEYKIAVKLKPKADFYWLFLAIAQEKSEKTEEAIESYKQVLILTPDKTLALYYLGKLYEKSGNIEEAIKTFEKLLKIDDEYDDASQRLDELKTRREQSKPQMNLKTKAAGQGTGKGNKP